jgi:hypothetical protein
LTIPLLLATFGLTGCAARYSPDEAPVSLAEWRPDHPPYVRANLVLSGTVVPVQVTASRQGDQVRLRLDAHGETLEEELYRLDGDAFRMEYAVGERFDPPVTLMQSPVRPGETWEWAGTLSVGPLSRRATANVVTSREELNLPGGPYDALRVNVTLSLDSGKATPAVRELRFWFAKGRGLVRREFGASSTREPAGP